MRQLLWHGGQEEMFSPRSGVGNILGRVEANILGRAQQGESASFSQ